MKRELRRLSGIVCLVMIGPLALPTLRASQNLDRLDRERAQVMLQNAASDVRRNYYDPKLHGVNWAAKVDEAKEKISKAASWEEAILDIAAVFETLDDSHTAFYPTQRFIPEDYGWHFQMFGDHCYVTHVRPGSDADKKGLKPGDELLTISGFTLTRESVKKIRYVVSGLLPQSSLRVELRDQSGKIRQVEVMARQRQNKEIMDMSDMTGRDVQELRLERENQRHLMQPQYTFEGEAMVLKLPIAFVTALKMEELIRNARKASSLILDLRGNPGGAESTLEDLLCNVFDRDIKIGDRVGREATTPLKVKSNHNAFPGKLIVLVDSESASASELFARVVQIEKRGVVLGDRTAGSVMEAQRFGHVTGINPVYAYGTLVSVADLVMSDGNRLEHTGVIPDEKVVPSAADLASGRDPAMARAAELAGASLSPEQAGKLFPYEWPN